jgi:2-keto-4-pentenoate hydratase/2-oxohepta-3-ene-1,7-dioic acid hydratase in catechol pathway
MRVCTFRLAEETDREGRAGVVTASMVAEPKDKVTVAELLDGGPEARRVLDEPARVHHLESVRLLAPVPRPGKILAAIVNTQGMLGGPDAKLDRPRFDTKMPSTVVGTGAEVVAPKSGIRPEVELAAVIGTRMSGASVEVAKKGIFGYTVLNDVTAPKDSKDDAYEAYRRDPKTGTVVKRVMRGPLFRSKNHDTFCPLGPWIVTSEELTRVSRLRMTARFEGRTVQDGSTADYLFMPEELVSYLSGFLTVEPGDVVSCGSVGWNKETIGDRDPTEFVLPATPGQMEVHVEGIGSLSNPVAYR